MTQYRKLAGTDILMKWDPVGNRWDPAEGEETQIAPYRGRQLPYQEPGQTTIPQPYTGPQTLIQVRTDAVDQAKAFSIRTWQFALVAGIAGIVVSVWWVGNPFIAYVTLKWWFGWFCLTYLAMFGVDTLASTQGQSFTHMLLGWVFIFREQNRRFRDEQ